MAISKERQDALEELVRIILENAKAKNYICVHAMAKVLSELAFKLSVEVG